MPGKNSSAAQTQRNAYRGINVLLLWGEATDKGFTLTLLDDLQTGPDAQSQCSQRQTRLFSRLCRQFQKTDTDDKGEKTEREILLLRAYTVFNAQQIAGLKEPYTAQTAPKGDPLSLIEHAEMFFAQTGATFRHGGNQAFYSPGHDVIQLPPPEAFKDVKSYAATKAHELVHGTKHEIRLAWDFNASRFGDYGYTREELVAEIGALSSALIWTLNRSRVTTTRPIWGTGLKC